MQAYSDDRVSILVHHYPCYPDDPKESASPTQTTVSQRLLAQHSEEAVANLATKQLLQLHIVAELVEPTTNVQQVRKAAQPTQLLDEVLLNEVKSAKVDDVDILLQDLHMLLHHHSDLLHHLLLEHRQLLQENLLLDQLLLQLLLQHELLDRNLLPRLELHLLDQLRELLLDEDGVEVLELQQLLLELRVVEDEAVQLAEVGAQVAVAQVDVADGLVLEALGVCVAADLFLVFDALIVLLVVVLVLLRIVLDDGRGGDGVDAFDGGEDLFLGSVGNEEVLGEDAAFGIGLVVAGVAGAGGVIDVAGLEGAGLEGLERVTADGGDLSGELENDVLVDLGSAVGGGVLMLGKSSDLGVDSLNGGAVNRG
jgi:hypothetical protein